MRFSLLMSLIIVSAGITGVFAADSISNTTYATLSLVSNVDIGGKNTLQGAKMSMSGVNAEAVRYSDIHLNVITQDNKYKLSDDALSVIKSVNKETNAVNQDRKFKPKTGRDILPGNYDGIIIFTVSDIK